MVVAGADDARRNLVVADVHHAADAHVVDAALDRLLDAEVQAAATVVVRGQLVTLAVVEDADRIQVPGAEHQQRRLPLEVEAEPVDVRTRRDVPGCADAVGQPRRCEPVIAMVVVLRERVRTAQGDKRTDGSRPPCHATDARQN